MSEQIENQEVEQVEEQQEERQFSAIEQKALEQGWRPKEEWDGEEDDFIDAKEFVRRGELFSKIDHQNKELKQIKSALEQFKVHHEKVEKNAYDRAIADLKSQRKAALAEGDVELYTQLDEQVDSLVEEKQEFIQKQKQVQPQGPAPEFVDWVNANPWYTRDPIMAGAADRLGVQLAQQGLEPIEVLRRVEREIKREFKHKFENPNRAKPSAVDAPRNVGNAGKGSFAPTDQERSIARNFVRAGLYKNENEYYSELEKMRKGK